MIFNLNTSLMFVQTLLYSTGQEWNEKRWCRERLVGDRKTMTEITVTVISVTDFRKVQLPKLFK